MYCLCIEIEDEIHFLEKRKPLWSQVQNDNSTSTGKPSNLLFIDNMQDTLTEHQRLYVKPLQYFNWQEIQV